MWMGLIQSAEGLKRKRMRFPKRGKFCFLTAFRLELQYQLFPGFPASRFQNCQLHNRVSQFLKTNLSASLSFHLSLYIYIHTYICTYTCVCVYIYIYIIYRYLETGLGKKFIWVFLKHLTECMISQTGHITPS